MEGSYDPLRVILSVVIAVLAAHLALDLGTRVTAARGHRASRAWLAAGAIAMGSGVWSMHFVGMLAFTLPVPFSFDPYITLSSIVIAIVVSGFALHVVSIGPLSRYRLCLAGLLMGIGIASMHYVGMAAMRMRPAIRYDPLLFTLSIGVAVLASMVALWIGARLSGTSVAHRAGKKLGAALLMGLAISGMHYIGMAAAQFAPGSVCGSVAGAISNSTLSYVVGGLAVVLSMAALAILALDSAFAARSAHLGNLLNRADRALEDRIGELQATSAQLQIEVSARSEAHQALLASQQKLDAVLASIDSVVWSICARTHRTLYLNAAAERVYGRPTSAFMADQALFLSIVHPLDRSRVAAMLPSLTEASSVTIEYRIVRPDGEIRWLEDRVTAVPGVDGVLERFDGVASDVTVRSAQEERLRFLAEHDALTGLANRARLIEQFRESTGRPEQDAPSLAVIYLSVDEIRTVKENYGHTFGDLLVQAVALRLSAVLGGQDLLACLQSDEFTALIRDVSNPSEARARASAFLACLAEPFTIQGVELFMTAFAGVSLYPRDGLDMELLLKHADTATRRARQEGDTGICIYRAELSDQGLENVELANDLRRALVRQEFELYYQPKVDLQSGRIVGLEALIRWHHPERGLVSPARFIPIAERSGLIIGIGEWVMHAACRQAHAWIASGIEMVPIAVNVSVRQGDSDRHLLFNLVQGALQASGLEPCYLELEITESCLMVNPEHFVVPLQTLRAMGIKVAIDDFGTGASSLSYLKGLPVDRLKIDRSFITDLVRDPDDAAIVRNIISLAHDLNLRVTAEGVETEPQLAFLQRQGCDEMQGYLFARPAPAAAVESMLRAGKRLDSPGLREDRHPPGQTLMLVDDDDIVLASLLATLRNEGYRIITASSGVEGLELMARHPVDVVLTDQQMPVMSGAEFLRRVRRIHPDTVRMVLSGNTELESLAAFINDGAIYKILSKPCAPEAIRRQVRDAFKHKALADENRRLAAEVRAVNRALETVNDQLEKLLSEKQEQLITHETTLGSLRAVLEQLPAAVIGIDVPGMVVFMNQDARQLFPQLVGSIGLGIETALPACLQALGAGRLQGPMDIEVEAVPFRAVRRELRSSSGPQGVLLVLIQGHRPTRPLRQIAPAPGSGV